MRLWHQSRTELGKLPAYERSMAEHFARVAEPGTVVDLHGLAPSTYATDYPTVDTRYPYFTYLHSLQILDNVQRAAREGYDGFLIVNLPDTVQEEAQSLVDIPVVGYAQAVMYVAAMLGRRFAILTMIPDFIPLYESHIDKYGMASRSSGVTPLGLDHAGVFAGFDDPAPVVRQVEARVRELAQQGVDVVIPGEAPVSAVLSRAGLSRVDDVPVVDGLGATLKLTESLVRLAEVSGMRASTHGYFNARPPAERLAELTRYYRLDQLGDPESRPADG